MADNMDFVAEMHKLNTTAANNIANNRLYNFSVAGSTEDDADNQSKKTKTTRDPMSHRIIEKRRRDRMNACLADLSHLIPTTILKQGQGRIEKTEIIEMAIIHIKLLQTKLHDSTPEKNKVCLEEKRLLGYKDCYADTALYMDQIGYSSSDTMYHNLCGYLNQQINKQKNKIACIYKAMQQHDHKPLQNPETNLESTKTEVSVQTQSDGMCYSADNRMGKNCTVANDKQELTLPSNDYQQTSMVEMRSEANIDSGLGSGSSGSGGSGNTGSSDMGSSDFSRNSSNYSAELKAYKYKNKIQERFSAVPEDKKPDIERDFASFNPKTSSLTGTDFSSEFHGQGNGSLKSSPGRRSSPSNSSDDSRNERDSCSLNNTVPAFALHPMGVHYIPLVLPVSQVMPFMRNHKSMGICHPVSIPVSFTGPFLMGEPEMGNCSSPESGRSTSIRRKHTSEKSMYSGSSGSDRASYNAKKTKHN